MKIKLILCDFDGTITKDDVLDRICALNGKEKESREINALRVPQTAAFGQAC